MNAMGSPGRWVEGRGRFRPLTEEEEIAQSVRMILGTRPGERPYRPAFGTRLDQFAFENIDTTTCNLIRQEIVRSLQTWEPRIRDIEVRFTHQPEQGRLVAEVRYQLRTTGVAGSAQVGLELA